MIERSGSKLLTNGSGSERPENMWIRWIRIRIRIRNTACNSEIVECGLSCALCDFFVAQKSIILISIFNWGSFSLSCSLLEYEFFSPCTWLDNIIYVTECKKVFLLVDAANTFILSHPPVIGRKIFNWARLMSPPHSPAVLRFWFMILSKKIET